MAAKLKIEKRGDEIGHATGKCNFTCANGYKKTIDILKCKKSGNWDHSINTVCESKNNIYIKKAPKKMYFYYK
jgi:hypothetical protein